MIMPQTVSQFPCATADYAGFGAFDPFVYLSEGTIVFPGVMDDMNGIRIGYPDLGAAVIGMGI